MDADQETEQRLPKMGLPVLIYCVALLGALYAYLSFAPRGPWLVLNIAVPVLAMAWMIRQGVRHRRAAGPMSAAQRTYLRRFVPLIFAYVVALFGAIWLRETLSPWGPFAAAIAILPALPLLGVIWALGRLLIEEKDEYQRSRTVRQFIIATGFMLAVTCIWGFLETFGQVRHVPMYWAFVVWCAGLGVGAMVNELKS